MIQEHFIIFNREEKWILALQYTWDIKVNFLKNLINKPMN